jgi:flavin reductase (DIM6/NTAB) family NADH-FMN oxidoreductase RutF
VGSRKILTTGASGGERLIMDLEWDDPRLRKFVTNIGLITTDGPEGPNIMAAEWTRHVSYSPSLLAINIYTNHATYRNIRHSKEFGVNICAADQSLVSSVAGGAKGSEVGKIGALKELGASFYKAKKINALMLSGASMNAECRVLKEEMVGDHAMIIGEVLEVSASDKPPLVYHGGRYYNLGEHIPKPPAGELERIGQIVAKHKK